MDYQLTIHAPGETAVRRITAEPDGLAQAVHRHVRGILGSSRVDVQLDGLAGTVTSHGAHVADIIFTPEAAPEPVAPSSSQGGIRYGWTLATLDALARSVVSNNRTWWPAGDREDLHSAAWHGIVEHLYTCEDEPRRGELMEAGREALARDVKDNMRHHGARRDGTNNGQKYAMYWGWAGRSTPSPEAGIVERIALQQILPALTAGQLAAVQALAAAGDYEAAARLVDSPASLKSQLMKGRRRFRELWHEGETPSGHWGVDRRAGTTAGTVGEGTALGRIRRRARTARAQGDAA